MFPRTITLLWDPLRAAVPSWRQTTQFLSRYLAKRDCSLNRVNGPKPLHTVNQNRRCAIGTRAREREREREGERVSWLGPRVLQQLIPPVLLQVQPEVHPPWIDNDAAHDAAEHLPFRRDGCIPYHASKRKKTATRVKDARRRQFRAVRWYDSEDGSHYRGP